MQLIGVDTGGTFTDAVLIQPDGSVGVGKALSTPGQLEKGVLASIESAAADLGRSLEDALSSTQFVAHGTTAGLNALLTRSGASVGLLTTRGFEATVPMARRANTVRGIDERFKTEAIRWDKPALLMSRRQIKGVVERVDADGGIVLPLDEAQAREAIADLGRRGVEAIGISLLWAHANPAHERRLAELVREQLPDVHVTVSSELAPRLGEYERTMTVVLNAYVGPLVAHYLEELDRSLRAHGFSGTFLLTKNSGGVERAASLGDRPIETLNSGPVGGLVATAALGRRLGHDNVVATDVGGTSFDVGLVVEGMPRYVQRPMIGRYDIATPVVDIVSIGTGGGSIAWLDPELGALRVGPASAGADPGPVCYGRGGSEPTVTDAAVALGYLVRIGGSLHLDVDAAKRAIDERIARPLSIAPESAAEGILQVASAQMADLVRRATLMRGFDPADFVLYAYGGAAPQYVGRYARQVGVKAAYVPSLASVFSALGAVSGDFRSEATADLAPTPLADAGDLLEEALARLEASATADLAGAGGVASDERLTVRRRLGLRFFRQVNELQVPLPAGRLDAALLGTVVDDFRRRYEQLVGAGTSVGEARVEVVNVSVEVALRLVEGSGEPSGRAVSAAYEGERSAFFDGRSQSCPVYPAAALAPGTVVVGPAFVEVPTTTLVVYPGQRAELDASGNLRLDLEVKP